MSEAEQPIEGSVNAFELLTAAVENLLSETAGLDSSLLLTDYCVVAMSQSYDDAGRLVTFPIVIPRDNEVPRYRLKGMLNEALDDLGSCGETVIIVSEEDFDGEVDTDDDE